ncbi:MAG: 5'-3' exonuclease [Euzebya sp.]
MTTSLLVDTSSLAYRAFFALPVSIADDEGNPVNAIRGYLDMVSTIVAELRPDVIAHCWDHSEIPAGRLAAYPQYKAARTQPPQEILWQFDLMRRLLPALGEVIVEAQGWEADDAIGTLCEQADDDDRVVVLTGDRDLIQLVRDPVVQVWFTVSGTRQLRRFDQAGVVDTYGIPASRYVDFAIMRGDPSDGLPGVKGIGEKTARALVGRYPTLAALVADAAAQTPKLGQTLAQASDYLEAMQQVVPVRTDLDLTRTGPRPDDALVAGLQASHALEGPIGRWQERRA